MSDSSQEVPGSPGLGDTDTESLYGAPPDGSDQPPAVENGSDSAAESSDDPEPV